VLTDHQALSKMFGQAEAPTGKLARWLSKMQPFKPWSGGNSDALSRELKTRQAATIFKDVEQWVKSCRMCQEHLDPQALKAARQQTIKTTQVLERMGMDLIGSLPKSKQGNMHILVMQDYFTKWPKVIPLKDATAKSPTYPFGHFIMGTSSGTPQQSGARFHIPSCRPAFLYMYWMSPHKSMKHTPY